MEWGLSIIIGCIVAAGTFFCLRMLVALDEDHRVFEAERKVAAPASPHILRISIRIGDPIGALEDVAKAMAAAIERDLSSGKNAPHDLAA